MFVGNNSKFDNNMLAYNSVKGGGIHCDTGGGEVKGNTITENKVTLPSPPHAKPVPNVTVGGTGNAVSIGQTGGVTVGTINVQKRPDRVVDEISGNGIIATLPAGTKKISVRSAMGDAEGQRFSHALVSFLNAHGLDAHYDGLAAWDPVPSGVVVVNHLEPDGTENIEVGTNE
jgi:hypothetical protein